MNLLQQRRDVIGNYRSESSHAQMGGEGDDDENVSQIEYDDEQQQSADERGYSIFMQGTPHPNSKRAFQSGF